MAPVQSGPGKPRASANFYAGATSGLVTTLMLQPLDVAKTRMQISSHFGRSVGVNNVLHIPDNAGVVQTLRFIVANDGVGGLWRGIVPTISRNMMGVGIYFVSLGKISDFLRAADGNLSAASTLVAGATARSLSASLLCPLSVIKTRFEAVELASKYSGVFNALSKITAEEGVKGLFSGLTPMIARDAPYSAMYVLFYLRAKEFLSSAVGLPAGIRGGFDKHKSGTRVEPRSSREKYVSMAVNFASGLVGGGLATILTQPQDVIKTRMQLSRHKHGRNDKYATVRQATTRVFKEEGLYGFFRGASPRFWKRCLGSAVTWMIYEETVTFYETLLEKNSLRIAQARQERQQALAQAQQTAPVAQPSSQQREARSNESSALR
uniref:Solute carrier family 25 member 38 homolog n=1 Tax=Erythrolobus madagascarensis TaxID=708628 RepID=A0A7S0T7P7_9RHOD|mmetsp:Transcript_1365/g.2787  ORF Transcript_1365/g.2787 Transcript_1365/m.2787 type:complete len:379 (+) Transcript_1365:395-1531(+)|eukprot:CAMPEP_0185850054 /NCGR_PEP_ID=MMETSP1354-20130828/4330_1 /TAXON_ID=708628 /ORGANISM="Erythrolobus madagascarensis, Strain CCMP3276" /LENGTH=378 /DNA_ID=CAMNT_0028550685 /DNA_START=377 /DNA_END=1513 /DNA_ORIENTATION=+